MPALLPSKSIQLGARSLLLLGLFIGGCSDLEQEKVGDVQAPIRTEQNVPGLKPSSDTEIPQETIPETDTATVEETPKVAEGRKLSASGIEINTEKTDARSSSQADPEIEPPEEPSSNVIFSDLDDIAAQQDIINLNKLGVFDTQDSEFKPYDSITRGQYVVWLFKANNALRRDADHIRFAPTFEPGYDDLEATHPAYKYIQAFANSGFAVGYEDNTFKPDQPITREEMIAIKVGLDRNEISEPLNSVKRYLKFADAEQIAPKYTGYIFHDQLGNNNIGRAFGAVKNLKPKQEVQRHEAAATLSRVSGVKVEKVVADLER